MAENIINLLTLLPHFDVKELGLNTIKILIEKKDTSIIVKIYQIDKDNKEHIRTIISEYREEDGSN